MEVIYSHKAHLFNNVIDSIGCEPFLLIQTSSFTTGKYVKL
jgi:hypothetical protein